MKKAASIDKNSKNVRRRRLIQWLLAPIVIVVISLGWKYPVLGFSVPVVMGLGMAFGLVKGRYTCGNLCPRGGFFDRMVKPFSRNADIPDFFRSMKFRWVVFVALMGFMTFQISRNPTSWEHWGHVFWIMCAVTTLVGVVLGVFINPRTWCSFCPMGTMQNAMGGGKNQLEIFTDSCRECRICEKACPMGIQIVDYKDFGKVGSRDCLKCPECIRACPKKALSWPGNEKAA